MIVDEMKLKSFLLSKEAAHPNLYFLYGKEAFLTKTYTDRLISRFLTEEDKAFNFVQMAEDFTVESLYEYANLLPIFCDKRVVLLSDLNFEKLDAAATKQFVAIISDLPTSTVVIISNKMLEVDAKKAKTKKAIATIDQYGVVCEFKPLAPRKIADMIVKKAARQKVTVNLETALYLAELTLHDLTLIGVEMDKLCSYAGEGGEITKGDVDTLVARQLDSSVYELAAAITASSSQKAFSLLSELERQGYPSVVILTALSGAFVDYYRAAIGTKYGAHQQAIADGFGYAKNRAWVVGKAISAQRGFSLKQIRQCISKLANADLMLKSSSVSDTVILQQVMTELIVTMGAK